MLTWLTLQCCQDLPDQDRLIEPRKIPQASVGTHAVKTTYCHAAFLSVAVTRQRVGNPSTAADLLWHVGVVNSSGGARGVLGPEVG